MKANEKTKKNSLLKIILTLIVLAVIIAILGFAWARYGSLITGKVNADVSTLSIKVNENTDEDFTIVLADTREGFEQEARVADGFVAPGTSGGFNIDIDATGSTVSLVYTIDIDISNLPENLIFYVDKGMTKRIPTIDKKIQIEKYINVNEENKKDNYTIYWKWPFVTGATDTRRKENDKLDYNWMDKKVEFPINVVGKQIDKAQTEKEKWAVVYDYKKSSTFEAGDYEDTDYIVDWDKDFKIEATINISESTNDRFLIVGGYDSKSSKELNLEVYKTQLRVYIGNASPVSQVMDGIVYPDEDVKITFDWDSINKKWNISAVGEETNILFDSKPNLSRKIC